MNACVPVSCPFKPGITAVNPPTPVIDVEAPQACQGGQSLLSTLLSLQSFCTSDSTTDSFVSLISLLEPNGVWANATIINNGSESLDLEIEYTNLFFVSGSGTTTVTSGSTFSWNSLMPAPGSTDPPPFSEVNFKVKSTVAGMPTTFDFCVSYFTQGVISS